MEIDLNIIKNDEKAILKLRSLYKKYGYSQYKMSKFEEYDLYVRNKDFLVSKEIITFTDTNGKLLALKPDVTLSIIKDSNDSQGFIEKRYYNENVYRVSKDSSSYKEIMQTGLECIGDIGSYEICEVVMLAAESLAQINENYILDISYMGIISALMEEYNIDKTLKTQIIECIGQKNSHEITLLCNQKNINENFIKKIQELVSVYGDINSVMEQLEKICNTETLRKPFLEFEKICSVLKNSKNSSRIHIDFSIVNDMNYYNDIVFKGYIEGIPTSVLSGGQYDNLMQKMGKKSKAIGFAVYLDFLERLDDFDNKYDVDIVLLYNQSNNEIEIINAVEKFIKNSKSIRAEKTLPTNIKYRQLFKITEGGIKAVEKCN